MHKRKKSSYPKDAISIISYFLLFTSSGICAIYYSRHTIHVEEISLHFIFITWILLAADSFFALLELIQRRLITPLQGLLEYAHVVSALPSLTVDVWLKNGLDPVLAYGHVLSAYFVVLVYLIQDYSRQDLADLVVFASSVSLFLTCFFFENYYFMTAGVSATLGYILFKRNKGGYKTPLNNDFYNASMIVFNVFIAKGAGNEMTVLKQK